MQLHEIENWALNIIERVIKSQPIEDSRVELKSDWISPEKAARRIAGHANAISNTEILWIIGVDEKKGIIGVNANELSDWHNKVKAQFNDIAPSFLSVNLSLKGQTVVALLFDTEAAPFVVKNPSFGKPGGGPVKLEVPWREGTATRSATRTDLLKILTPLSRLPQIEVTGGLLWANVSKYNKDELEWILRLFLYIEPPHNERIVIPFHRCTGYFMLPKAHERLDFSYVDLEPLELTFTGKRHKQPDLIYTKKFSKTIEKTDSELLVNGPGKVFLNGQERTKLLRLGSTDEARIYMSLSVSNAHTKIPINVTLLRAESSDKYCEFYWHKE